MKIAILGYDVEGRASYDYFALQGHEIVIHDQKPDLNVPEGAKSVLGDAYLDNLDEYDVLVRTAGMHPELILDKNPGVKAKITTHVNEFFKASPTKNIIGVTGTKGKGTTSTLIAKMLEASGKEVKLGGNIGLAPLTFLKELGEDSWVVLEMSSFQLIDIKTSPNIAVCLMVVPEHLDWHPDINEYITAKSQLFAHQSEMDIAVYLDGNEQSKMIASSGKGQKIPYYAPPGAFVDGDSITIDDQVICRTDELKLLGAHNWQNACAAVTAVWQITQDIDAIRSVLTSFTGLPHRLELVRELHGVRYYDDSFGTTPETAMVAVEAFAEPKVLIAGGSDKGGDFSGLARSVASGNVRQVLLIGNTSQPHHKTTASKIEVALRSVGFEAITSFVKPGGATMNEIVLAAQSLAQPGDVVLLSTGSASFDMFKNYKDRGEQFSQAVQVLV